MTGGTGTWVRAVEGGSHVSVWVVPGSSRSVVDGVHGDTLKVRVAAPRERGRATAAVARLLADRLRADVELVGGAAGRRKTFLVRGLAPAEVVSRLAVDRPPPLVT